MSRIIENKDIRNIAIIAHVDHGKTTLVDAMFRQSGLFRTGQVVDERIMDNMDLERERGITIAAKNCSVSWKGVKINIIDTPGHSDFGAEVERALSMADGAILLVDASEGPLPQTRFVLKKTLEAGLKVIVVINKIDRKDAQTSQVLNAIYDLFIDLGARDDQIDFPILYAVGRDGIAKRTLEEATDNIHQLFDTIIDEIPPPVYDSEEPFQMLVSDLGYSDYLGRLAVGKIINGTVSSNKQLVCINKNGKHVPLKVTKLHKYEGMSYKPSESASAGDIAVLAGIDELALPPPDPGTGLRATTGPACRLVCHSSTRFPWLGRALRLLLLLPSLARPGTGTPDDRVTRSRGRADLRPHPGQRGDQRHEVVWSRAELICS